MKSYKQRTLDAQLDLIRRYKKNDPPGTCPFCEIYDGGWSCRGCFMCRTNGYNSGCLDFESFVESKDMSYTCYTEKQRLTRANFHRKVRKILLKRPAKYFTPKGWKYLNIPKEW